MLNDTDNKLQSLISALSATKRIYWSHGTRFYPVTLRVDPIVNLQHLKNGSIAILRKVFCNLVKSSNFNGISDGVVSGSVGSIWFSD